MITTICVFPFCCGRPTDAAAHLGIGEMRQQSLPWSSSIIKSGLMTDQTIPFLYHEARFWAICARLFGIRNQGFSGGASARRLNNPIRLHSMHLKMHMPKALREIALVDSLF
jgi:hypothetical protein